MDIFNFHAAYKKISHTCPYAANLAMQFVDALNRNAQFPQKQSPEIFYVTTVK